MTLLIGRPTFGEELSFIADEGLETSAQVAVNDVAQDEVQVIGNDQGTVEVVSSFQPSVKYKDRRGKSSFFFEVGADNFYPADYQSLKDSALYTDLFGEEDLTLLQIELGWQLNTKIGSVAASFLYGQGSLEDDRTGNLRSLAITKPSLKLGFQLDTLFEEPYVIPYASFSFWQMGLKETSTAGTVVTENTKQTGFGTTMTAGTLIQLNWLDSDSALTAYRDFGLQNTYLNIAINRYADTSGDGDPSTFSDFNWSAGLRLEF